LSLIEEEKIVHVAISPVAAFFLVAAMIVVRHPFQQALEVIYG
jgi:hypothetical protein